MSESREAFETAFVVAQRNFKPIPLNREGQIQNRKYRYADLAAVLQATVPALNEVGISIRQRISLSEGQMICITELNLGAYSQESDGFPIGYDPNDPQAVGKATTYARRYDLCAFLGVVGEEDTDAAGPEPKAKGKSRPTQVSQKDGDDSTPPDSGKSQQGGMAEHGRALNDVLMDGIELLSGFADEEVRKFWDAKLREKHQEGNQKVLLAMVESVRRQVENA